ncbi:MAG: RdgB/HAM1 family non-canonical purine NTP pyrophosphatase [Rickettsiales bacterium]|jgi:XTP/dITP diphosphohydrolase|nr:RdgB/HAM1 family non-canonical purine NTP pyrophosphatase [Rickettsiales bacterium]
MSSKFPYDKLLIASNNPGKVREIKSLLDPYGIEIFSITDFDVEEPEETEATFIGNARLKAAYYGKRLSLPALADDSGISIEELGGFPGVYSARIAGPDKDFTIAFDKIEKMLAEKDLKTSPAFFTCALSLWHPDGIIEDFEGRIDGIVSFPAIGMHGFGYDPIFTLNGYNKRLSEMAPEEKNKLSHRSLAFKKFIEHCF